MSKTNRYPIIHDPYRVRVGSTIDVNKPLVRPNITVELSPKSQLQPINTGGIDVGKCTTVGEIKARTFEGIS